MAPKKSIFRQPGAKHFQLVHRSQRDPLINDPDASQHVLKQFERENVKKGKSRAELEHLLSSSEIEHDRKHNVGEAALYGIYYDDTEYDYMQHLRPVGIQEDGVENILIEASSSRKDKGKTKKDDLDLPEGVLPSSMELPRNYESQQPIPDSIAGFQPDMNPHLRQTLEALENEAFVDDELDDSFFGELIASGERVIEEAVDFDFGDIEDETNDPQYKDNETSKEDQTWEEQFALFKKSQQSKGDADSDDDTIGGLPTISVIGGKGRRRRKGGSDASGYSMSSSSMYRNEALQTLDERFDRIMSNIYEENEDEEPPADDDSDVDEYDQVPELITSREDFDSMVKEFLNDYEVLGKKMKPKLEGNSGTDKLDTLRQALGQDERILIKGNDPGDVQDVATFETGSKKDNWDCETILTTYSNYENRPRIIHVSNPNQTPKISVDPKTGFPIVDGIPKKSANKRAIKIGLPIESDSSDETENENTVHKCPVVARPRNETKEEKQTRKAAAKAEKQVRREEKRLTKEKFDAELKHQKKVLAAKPPRMRRL